MKDDFDAQTLELQDEVFAAAQVMWGEAAHKRWLNPLFMGTLPDPDGQATLNGDCGDSMTIQLKIEHQQVSDAVFWTTGCGPSVVCGSFAAEMARGKSPEELLDFAGETILAATGGLPEDHLHCAFLAARTLASAANDYFVRQTKENESAAK